MNTKHSDHAIIDGPRLSKRFVFVIAISALLRLLCYVYGYDLLSNRPELSNPFVSFKSLLDGVFMRKDGVDPYSGSLLHMQPLLLSLFSHCEGPSFLLLSLFIVFDIIASYTLFLAVSRRSLQTAELVAFCYLLNPYTIFSCAIFSLSTLFNLLVCALFCALTMEMLAVSSILLAVLSNLFLYPVILIGSLWMFFPETRRRVHSTAIFVVYFVALLSVSWMLNGFNWNFIDNTYSFMLSVEDLTPNTGVYWYLMTQVFDQFRSFYLSICCWILVVYATILFLTIKCNNGLHFVLSLMVLVIFFPYPTLNFGSVYIALLPLLTLDYPIKPLRFILPSSAAMVTCAVLMPLMWQMWIVLGSGNANFFFGATLVYNFVQVYLIIDFVYAYFRKELSTVSEDLVIDDYLLTFWPSLRNLVVDKRKKD